jgi:hypothetical protein
MPVADDVGGAPGNVYESLCAQAELEYQLWLGQGWRRNEMDRPYHHQAQLDAARAGAPIDLAVSRLPAPHRPAGAWDIFDRVTVSPDGSMRFTGADVAAWCEEEGL